MEARIENGKLMTLAEKYERGMRHSELIPGTGCDGVGATTISGIGYTVARFRDSSWLAWCTKTGYVYGIGTDATEYTLDLHARIGRLITQLSEPERVRQTLESGTLLATGECGIRWYRIGETVWCVRSETQCDYCGLWSDWRVPAHADAA